MIMNGLLSLFTGLTTELSYTVTANYQLLGIVDILNLLKLHLTLSHLVLMIHLLNLQAETFSNNVCIKLGSSCFCRKLELSYDDGNMMNATYYAGAVAVRFRVNGSYEVNAIANAIWMGIGQMIHMDKLHLN